MMCITTTSSFVRCFHVFVLGTMFSWHFALKSRTTGKVHLNSNKKKKGRSTVSKKLEFQLAKFFIITNTRKADIRLPELVFSGFVLTHEPTYLPFFVGFWADIITTKPASSSTLFEFNCSRRKQFDSFHNFQSSIPLKTCT
jgi:hypothetical protein